ncbi:MAG: hypothetical protein AB8H03_19245 [Saprospiraceae bacterium]
MKIIFIGMILLSFLSSCENNELKKQNGISLDEIESEEKGSSTQTKKELRTRPSNVLLTGHSNHRLVTVYKINYNSRTKAYYTGTNNFLRNYSYSYDESYDGYGSGRRVKTHQFFMPGIEAVAGYNMMNVSHYNFKTKEKSNLFEKPVLVNTLYYPCLQQDSLQGQPINRDYYMVSVFDEDTNQDSLINRNDLRRFYHFDLDGLNKSPLIPSNYSVMSSEYDAENDVMYVFAKLDRNANGKREEEEPIHIFWLDLKIPKMGERLY